MSGGRTASYFAANVPKTARKTNDNVDDAHWNAALAP